MSEHIPDSRDAPQLNIPDRYDIRTVIQTSPSSWTVVTPDDIHLVVKYPDGFDCTCSDNTSVTHTQTPADARQADGPATHTDMSHQTATDVHATAQCPHVGCIQNALNDPCPACGSHSHTVRPHYRRGEVVLEEPVCTRCHTSLLTE